MAARRSNQDLAGKEADKAANRAQMDAQWARNTTKLNKYDGLRSKEVLEGSFHVPALEDSADVIGPMDQVCPFCKALKFKGEPPKLCCMNGKIQIPCFPRPAQEFVNLYRPQNTEAESKSKVFKKYIRSLNNSCCLSSLKANKRQSRYAPTVIFQGQAHQFAGPLQARDGERPVFAQLYVLDPSLEFTKRFANLSVPQNITVQEKGELGEILLELQELLKRDNPYIKDYRQIIEIPDEELATGRLVILASARPTGEHERRYNSPVCLEEVSVLSNNGKHDLVITKRDGRLEIVSEQNQSAMPLHFTLLFPSGTKGWHPGLKQSPDSNKRLTTRDFALFHLACRQEGTVEGAEYFNLIHYGDRLFQEFIEKGGRKHGTQLDVAESERTPS